MEQIKITKDGKKMRYIPGGKYIMGSERGASGQGPHELAAVSIEQRTN